MKINARKMALKMLNNITIENTFSHHVINTYFDEYDLQDIDRRFISNIVLGVLENQMLIDFYIRKFSKVRFGKINKEIVNVLRIGIYQVLFMDKVPASAAVNESVKMAKRINPSQGNYVNAVLRNFLRGYETTPLPDKKRHAEEYLSIKYSHPLWLVNLWEHQYGKAFTESLLKANNQMAPICLRVNLTKTTVEAFEKRLTAQGFEFQRYAGIEEAIIIKNLGSKRIAEIDGYCEGHFQIQDISSMHIAKVSDVKSGDLVIDVCAAPGGKSCHMAEIMQNKGKVIARDLYEHKCALIRENAERLGLSIVVSEMHDAVKFDKTYTQKADVVLVDAPCSGLGIIRRKPDIKYNKENEDLTSLVAIQKEILSVSSEYVKPGGILIYSTCTLNDAENIEQVKSFLAHHKSFELCDLSAYSKSEEATVTLFPNVHGTDGFFIAKMKRI